MRARRQRADALETRCRAGTLPDRGASPTRANLALDTKCLHCAPLNGRAFVDCRRVSKPVRARVFRARARRYESVRRLKTIAKCENILFEVLLQVRCSCIENWRGSCTRRGLVSIAESVPALLRVARVVASIVCACAGLYGFMKCKSECVSTLICVLYLENNFSNCPVSWRKPVGVAGVRTLNPCLMVRKDTNSKK